MFSPGFAGTYSPQPDDRDPGGCSTFHPGNLVNRVYGLLFGRLHLGFPHPQLAPNYPSLDTFSSLCRWSIVLVVGFFRLGGPDLQLLSCVGSSSTASAPLRTGCTFSSTYPKRYWSSSAHSDIVPSVERPYILLEPYLPLVDDSENRVVEVV